MRMSAWVSIAASCVALPAMAENSASVAHKPTAAPAAVNVNAPRPALPPEKLLAMRNALMSRIAVYDAVDKSWRAPTASEQAELTQGSLPSGEPSVVTLSNGGVALQGDAVDVSFLTVERQQDGTLKMDHAAVAAVPTPRLKSSAVSTKGGRHVE